MFRVGIALIATVACSGRPVTIGEIHRNLTAGNPLQRFPELIAARDLKQLQIGALGAAQALICRKKQLDISLTRLRQKLRQIGDPSDCGRPMALVIACRRQRVGKLGIDAGLCHFKCNRF